MGQQIEGKIGETSAVVDQIARRRGKEHPVIGSTKEERIAEAVELSSNIVGRGSCFVFFI